MRIHWQCEDGYVGGSRPQDFEMHNDEILEHDTVEEAMSMIRGYIEDDFLQKCSAAYDEDKIRAEVEKLFASKPK